MNVYYSYDARNRLTNLSVAPASLPASPLLSYAYTLDAAGHRTSVTELSGRKAAYAYDNLYRLTSGTIASDPGGQNGAIGYIYDPVGNRAQQASTVPAIAACTFFYDANDRFTAGDTYDANGNTVSSGGTVNVYDFENHLIQKDAGITIVYDGDGNRVKKTVAGVTTLYLVDDQNPTGYAQVMGEEAPSTAVLEGYVYGLEQINRVKINGAAPTVFYVHDGHGSVRALTNATGAVTDTYDYDAFGNLIHSTGSTPNNYLFAGEQFDPDLGLYYNRARYLNTNTGRFWGMDSDEGDDTDPLSLHKYLYTKDGPVDGVDASGNDDLVELTASFSISETLDAMPQLQATNLAARLGIGLEVPEKSAVKDNVLNVAQDPGHAVVYLKDSTRKVVSILSFGPGQLILDNVELFINGGLRGDAHWPLTGSVSTWESTITSQQLATGKQAIADFKAHVPNYTPEFQCTTAALSIAKKVGLNLPSGVGPVIAKKFGRTYFRGDVSNPYHLSQQMTAMYGPPEVVNASAFPNP